MKAIVWSKEKCPMCVQAKTFLNSKNVEYEERIVGVDWTKEQLLEQVPNARSVPQIVIDDKYVGGYVELRNFLSTQNSKQANLTLQYTFTKLYERLK